MPRDGSGVYSAPPGTTATPETTILSTPYNAFVADLVADANSARPISAGGTGATNTEDARSNLGVTAALDLKVSTDGSTPIVGNQTITKSDDSASTGPILTLKRVSASPAASDNLGQVSFIGKDSAGNDTLYAAILASIQSATDGGELGTLSVDVVVSGILKQVAVFYQDGLSFDTNKFIGLPSGVMTIGFDVNDFLAYDPTNNILNLNIGDVNYMGVGSAVNGSDLNNFKTVTIANGASFNLKAASGLLVLNETQSFGNAAVFVLGGNAVTLLGTTGSRFEASASPASGHIGVAYNGSNSYYIYNNTGSSIGIAKIFLATRLST